MYSEWIINLAPVQVWYFGKFFKCK